jgi:hypothetical protein
LGFGLWALGFGLWASGFWRQNSGFFTSWGDEAQAQGLCREAWAGTKALRFKRTVEGKA